MRERLWAEPDVRVFMVGRTISELGSRITREGLPIVAILAVGATAPQVALLAALSSVAGMLAAPGAGVLADRVRRRPVMIAADVLRALALLTIPAAAFAHRLTFLQIAAVFAFVGGASSLFDVADQAWLPQFVSRRRLAEGNALVSGAAAAGETGGPALMGVLFQWLGGPAAIAFDAVSYVASAVSLLWIRRPEPPPESGRERAAALREAVAGLRAVLAHPLLRPLVLTAATQSLFSGFFGALYEVYALRELRLNPLALGVLITAGGVGALAGSMAAPALIRRIGTRRALLLAPLVYGALAWLVPLAHTPFALAFGALFAAQMCGDLAGTVFRVSDAVVRQTVTPDGWLGRVGGARAWLGGTLSTAGALVAGGLAAAIGMRGALFVAAAGQLLAPAWLLFSAVRAMGEERLHTSAFAAPAAPAPWS
jgi:MFS family permease